MNSRDVAGVSLACLAALAILLNRCHHQAPPTAAQVRQVAPSVLVERRTEAGGVELTRWTQMVADRDGAIVRMEQERGKLAQQLATALKRSRRITTATVFQTATPCGDTLTQEVATRTERAPGLLGFMRARVPFVDVRQITPGATTIGLQSYAQPPDRVRRLGVGVFVGYGVGPSLKPTPMVGVGLSYNLLSF